MDTESEDDFVEDILTSLSKANIVRVDTTEKLQPKEENHPEKVTLSHGAPDTDKVLLEEVSAEMIISENILPSISKRNVNRVDTTEKLKPVEYHHEKVGLQLTDGIPDEVLLEEVSAEIIVSEDLNVSDLWPLGYSTEVPHGLSPQPHENLSYSSNIVEQAGEEFSVVVEGTEDIVPDSFHDNDILASDPDDPDYTFPQSEQSSSGSSVEEDSDVLMIRPTSTGEEENCDVLLERPLHLGEDIETRIKRKRNRKAVPADWQKNKIKKLRMHGQKYIGYERKKVNDKMVVTKTNTEREERKLGQRCNSKVCLANKERKCSEFSEPERENIFKSFWDLSWKEKEVFVCSSVTLCKPKRSTSSKDTSRRSGTITYRLKHQGILKPVCKQFFLKTLDIGEWTALNWIKRNEMCKTKDSDNIDEPQEMDVEENSENNNSVNTSVSKSHPGKRRSTVKKDTVREWLEMLPKLPSHYTRKDTTKSYLEPTFESKSELYREYKRYCTENEKPIASIALFFDMFDEMRLSIHIPRKDQCNTCCSYKAGNLPKNVLDNHIAEKNRARLEKDNDKSKAVNGEIYCLNADVQAVKITPLTKASAFYYKTKLCSHNFSVYNLSNHQCTCYWFNECEGDLTANTFASCIYDYLEKKCLAPKLPIVLYTDGCTAQNRNHVLSNALLHFSVKYQVEVVQKFLIKGHTQMEGDSVHAKIENKLKNKDVYVPYEFVKYTQEARINPFPYEAKYLKYDFFKDYSKLDYYPSIRPGRKAGDPVVTDVHCLRYDPKGVIQYKLQFDDEYNDLPRRLSKVNVDIELKKLHAARLPIQASKFKHLQELKSVIPEDFHSFYDNLPHL